MINSSNPITTISLTHLPFGASTTTENIFPRRISSATRTPGIFEFQTHLLTINHTAQTRCARGFLPDYPEIEYSLPETWSPCYWQTGLAFSSLTAWSRHLSSHVLVHEFCNIVNTDLLLSASRTSSPSSTYSWNFHELMCGVFSS